jgi:hypothetical protein
MDCDRFSKSRVCHAPDDRRSGTHRKWIGMGQAAVNSEITFSSSLEKSVGASVSVLGGEAG